MDITQYKIEQGNYKPSVSVTAESETKTNLVKLSVRGNRHALIFVSEKPPLRGGGGGGNEQEHKITHHLIPQDLPRNYILAVKNAQVYRETAVKITSALKDSFVINYNGTTSEDVFKKLRGCNRLDQDPNDLRKFLFVTEKIVSRCLGDQNLDPEKRPLYISALLGFYQIANSLYSEEHGNIVEGGGGLASTTARLLVNNERILLRLEETGIHFQTYEKVFLSQMLQVLDAQAKTISTYREHLENAEISWSKLFSGYQILQNISEGKIQTLENNLAASLRVIEKLNLSLLSEQQRYFFARYWRTLLLAMPFLLFLVMTYIWLLRHVIRSKKSVPPVHVTIVQPPAQTGGNTVSLDKVIEEPPSPVQIPDLASKLKGYRVFSFTHIVLYLESVLLAILLSQKVKTVEKTEWQTVNKLQLQEVDSALHQRKLKLLNPTVDTDDSKRFSAEINAKKNIFETVNKLSDDILNLGKLILGSAFLSFIGRRK
jgi:hypothetical protein